MNRTGGTRSAIDRPAFHRSSTPREPWDDPFPAVSTAPVAVGAGKPYDTDTRLEDHTEAAILRAEGKRTEAMRLLAGVGDVSLPWRENAGLQDRMLTAAVLRELQRQGNDPADYRDRAH